MKPINCLLLLVLTAVTCPALGQKHQQALEDKTLVQCFSRLNTLDGYSYRTSIQSSLVADTQEKKPLLMDIYQSKERFVAYSRSEEGLFFLCSRGLFKVEESSRTVYYKLFTDDSMLISAKENYLVRGVQNLDSFFLLNAVIKQKKIKKTDISYQLGYPDGAMVKELQLTAVPVSLVPVKISYTITRPVSARNPGILVRQRVVMDQYRRSVPVEVNTLEKEAMDLYGYLQKKYPDYTLKSI